MTRNIAKRQRVRVADARIFHAQFNWRDVERIKKGFDIPLILKGIDTAEDAKIAVEHRVGCVYVSNHGGRQPDQGVGSIDVLPEVVDAVGGHARIIVDGGIGRGADAVACGRASGCLGSSTAMTRASAATRRMPRTGRGRGGA